MIQQAGIDAVPFQHPDLDIWRSNFKGIRALHRESNVILSGALDDVWVKKNGELIVADYKATSTTEPISLDSGYKDVFKRQLEIYQWILRQNGFTVDQMACLVYANARKDKPDFAGKLEFDLKVLCHSGDTSWIENALMDVRACLSADKPPLPKKTVNKRGEEEYCCKYCEYYEARKAVL